MLSLFAILELPVASLSGVLLAEKNNGYSWGIVLFFIALGLIVALSPVRRTSEVKKPKDE